MPYIVLALLLIVAACVSDKAVEEKLARSNMITLKNSSIKVPPSATFTWAPGLTRYFDDPRFEHAPLQGMFHSAIKETLTRKGFHYGISPAQSDLLVGYILALESALDDEAIKGLYGFEPGFNSESPDKDKYEKGTVIIDVYDAKTRQSVWRSVLQGLAVFDVSDEERRARVDATVRMMLEEFPGGA